MDVNDKKTSAIVNVNYDESLFGSSMVFFSDIGTFQVDYMDLLVSLSRDDVLIYSGKRISNCYFGKNHVKFNHGTYKVPDNLCLQDGVNLGISKEAKSGRTKIHELYLNELKFAEIRYVVNGFFMVDIKYEIEVEDSDNDDELINIALFAFCYLHNKQKNAAN